MILVDTNVFVHAANALSPAHADCAAFLLKRRNRPEAWYSTWSIFYEFFRVTTHANVMKPPWTAKRAFDFVSAILASPGFSVLAPTPRHADVAAEVFKESPQLAGNVFHDAHTAVLMREHGIKTIVTRDIDFHRFRFLEVIDPADA